MSKKQLLAPKPAMVHLGVDYFTLPQLIQYANAVAADINDEANEYWAFIAGIASYFGCKDGVDMRDFIMQEFDKLKASAVRGEALARTVMADQVGKS